MQAYALLIALMAIACLTSITDAQKKRKNKGLKRKSGGRGDGDEKRGKKGKGKNAQTLSLNNWGASLTDADYSYKTWPKPSVAFHTYTKRLSDMFLANNANINFVLVGACDGTHDKTIAERFLPNLHWRAAFVEAISFNVRDLTEMLGNHSALDRSHVFHAAATDVCVNSTIAVQRPKLEEKSASIAHWMRRQIGSIASKNHLLPEVAQKDRANWAIEQVRCVTGADVLREWTTSLYSAKMAQRQRFRPHVLKIDAEGHDYEVLVSFIEPMNDFQLPLLIDFEAKSLLDKYPKVVELLLSR